jgi:SAM-dependent methyltransferase
MANVGAKDQCGDRRADRTRPLNDTPSAAIQTNPHGHGAVSDWVERFLPGVPAGGCVIDVACGAGRHLRLARRLGHPVLGLDRDVSGLADLAGAEGVEIVAHDLEVAGGLVLPFGARRFAGVVVTNYLFRPLFPVARDLVAEDGVLIWETFALGQERHGKPSNPAFLLGPNELLSPDLVGGLTVVAFEQGETVTASGSPRITQRVVAVGARHPWTREAPRRL